MELKQLQYFVTCVDMGSMNRAAETLYVTQSHISKTIRSLEEELGVTLLERTSSGIRATDAGRRVYAYAETILAAEQHIAEVRREEQRFRLAAMPGWELAHLFAQFCGCGNPLFVQYREGTPEQVLHQVAHQQAELGLLLVSEHRQQAFQASLTRSRLAFVPLSYAQPSVCAGPQNPYYAAAPLRWTELRRLRLIQPDKGTLTLLRHLSKVGGSLSDPAALRTAAAVSSDSAAFQLLRQTDLASICFRLCRDPLFPEPLHVIPIEGGGAVQFGYLYRLDAPPGAQEQRLIDLLKGALL